MNSELNGGFMHIFDFISFYYQNMMAFLFRQNTCYENYKKAIKNADFVRFQVSDNRNKIWLEMSLRDREILVENIMLCVLGIRHPQLEYVFYLMMDEDARKNKLKSIFDFDIK
jgi:hypothetical protein